MDQAAEAVGLASYLKDKGFSAVVHSIASPGGDEVGDGLNAIWIGRDDEGGGVDDEENEGDGDGDRQANNNDGGGDFSGHQTDQGG